MNERDERSTTGIEREWMTLQTLEAIRRERRALAIYAFMSGVFTALIVVFVAALLLGWH